MGREVIMAGLLDREFGIDLSNAFEMRQASTYDIYESFGEEEVREIVDKAERFIKRIKEILKDY